MLTFVYKKVKWLLIQMIVYFQEGRRQNNNSDEEKKNGTKKRTQFHEKPISLFPFTWNACITFLQVLWSLDIYNNN